MIECIWTFNSFNDTKSRSSRLEVFCKKVLLAILQNSQEDTCARISFFIKLQDDACNFIKKETLAQVFSFEFCKISKNTFSYRTPPVAASGKAVNKSKYLVSFTLIYPFECWIWDHLIFGCSSFGLSLIKQKCKHNYHYWNIWYIQLEIK